MGDLEQWKLDLENYYRNQFFMDPKHKDDWQEAARQAAEAQYQAELGKRQTSVDLPEVTVTASNPTKTVAAASDWDPGYSKFMSGERYYADKDHKNYLDLQRNDMTNSIRETTDKWGKGIGLGMAAAAALPFATSAAAYITSPAGWATIQPIIGETAKSMLGYMAIDKASQVVSGKTFGQNIADTMGYIPGLRKIPYQHREFLGSMANPGAYLSVLPKMASSAAMNLNLINNTVANSLNNIKNRTLETALRIGDGFGVKPVKTFSTQLFGNKASGLRYIFGGDNNFAYQLPYRYDGMRYASTAAHRGDLIDVLMGKSNKLLSKDGNVLGELTSDLSNVPESTIKSFQTLPGRSSTQPQILKMKYPTEQILWDQQLDALIHNSVSTPTQIFRHQAAGLPVKVKGPYATFPENDSYYHLSKSFHPDFEKMFAIDPGHYGVTGVNTADGLKVFGHDVYHFSPKLYEKTNISKGIFKHFDFTAGNPFIAEWEINPLIPKYDFYRRFRFNQPVDLSTFTSKPYLNTLNQSQVSVPFRADIAYRHGGRLNKKKNKGKFAKVRDYVDYKSNK